MGDNQHGMDVRERVQGDFTTDKRVLLLSAMALFIGAVCSVIAALLLGLINLISNFTFFQKFSTESISPALHHLGPLVVLAPIVGGLIIGLMARYGSDKIRGHGIPEALEAILIGRSRMSVRVAILKPISSAISIGTGGPFGAEGPIIMTGGAAGSLFGQLFHLSPAERKTLLVAGAAGGMAAVFAAPVAAVLLAVELLLFEWKPRSFIPVAVAAATASWCRVILLGQGPLFPVPPHAAAGWQELITAVGLGVGSGLLASLLTLAVYGCEDLFQHLPVHWMWWPAIGGAAVGVGALIDPRVLGVGYDIIRDLLGGKLVGAAPAGLLLAKGLVWAVALGSGTSGGVLAPLLIIGGAWGAVVAGWIPFGDPGLWAMAGMAAVMGGTMRSPLTAMVFALELTHDVNALPLLLVAVIPAHAVTVLLMRRSILTEKVARRGYHVAREYSVDPLALVRVRDVMDSEAPAVRGSMKLADLAAAIAKNERLYVRHQALPIVDDAGKLAGIITRGDIVRALQNNPGGDITVLEAGTKNPVVASPDEPLSDAVATMAHYGVGRLPVVENGQLVGYLGRGSILTARQRLLEEEFRREPGLLTMRWRSRLKDSL
ncbi:MAG TPA: chloride channel protein [Bacteroidota bacterium]